MSRDIGGFWLFGTKFNPCRNLGALTMWNPTLWSELAQQLYEPQPIVLWTLQSSRGCLDSYSVIGLVSQYVCDHRRRCDHSMEADRRSDICLPVGDIMTRKQVEMRVIGSRERTCFPWICRKSTRSIQWLRQISWGGGERGLGEWRCWQGTLLKVDIPTESQNENSHSS